MSELGIHAQRQVSGQALNRIFKIPSFPRRRESNFVRTWVPANAGMTAMVLAVAPYAQRKDEQP